MRITIIGTGYVGITTAVALAHIGHDVTAVDKDQRKLELLKRGQSPIHEPGLSQLLTQVASHIHFTDGTVEAVGQSEVVIIAVGTPPRENGEADTRFVEAAALEISEGIQQGQTCTIVVKSTVPIGANRRVAHVVGRALQDRGVEAGVHFASNPEFLREGVALRDTFYPDRIVVGADHETATDALRRMYRPLLEQTFTPPSFLPRPERFQLPVFITTDLASAEMIKYAANAFLALKVSFINEIAGLCEKVGANVTEVSRGVGTDSRIGQRFLSAGVGWGGSCFPKDTAALISVAGEYGYPMPIVEAARAVNIRQRAAVVEKLQKTLKVVRGRVVTVLGIAFKPNTDDVRDSPAIEIIRTLVERGAHVRAHDPVATCTSERELAGLGVEILDDPYAAVRGAEAVLIATGWDEYRGLDLCRLAAAMKTPAMVDGVNLYEAADARAAGFEYTGVGR